MGVRSYEAWATCVEKVAVQATVATSIATCLCDQVLIVVIVVVARDRRREKKKKKEKAKAYRDGGADEQYDDNGWSDGSGAESDGEDVIASEVWEH